MTIGDCYKEGLKELGKVYDSKEAKAICLRLLSDKYGITKESLLLHENDKATFLRSFRNSIKKLCLRHPLQHITGFQQFFERPYRVSRSTLVPRVETEELVTRIIDTVRSKEVRRPLRILDIGTGSGAIAVTLALEISDSNVTAIDISERALKIARQNALANGAKVEFLRCDFLNAKERAVLENSRWDIIVSNPPYIPKKDIDTVDPSVAAFEPRRALYIDDRKPVIFYSTISRFAWDTLNDDGMLFFEINETLAEETAEEIRHAGFSDVSVCRDLFNKYRFACTQKQA